MNRIDAKNRSADICINKDYVMEAVIMTKCRTYEQCQLIDLFASSQVWVG